MDTLFSRYRNITVLLVAVCAQIILLAYQVKNGSDVRMIRIWAVTAVTPLAQVVEDSRSTVAGFFGSYVDLRAVREQNRKMQSELSTLKLENRFLRNEISVADRVKALSQFEARSPSKMLAARIIGTGSGAANRIAFVDRGSTAGVEKGMGVVTPDGIVGKVLSSYPTASQVLMVDDPGFAAGVVSQKNHVRGILRGAGHGQCQVDFIQNEEAVELGELFYTTGDDRVFPKGMPAGKVVSVSAGSSFKTVAVEPIGLARGPEEVLIVLEGRHQAIPDEPPQQTLYLGKSPNPAPDSEAAGASAKGAEGALLTDADRARQHYKELGEAQNHKFGEGAPGSLPPDFNAKPKPPVVLPRSEQAAPAKRSYRGRRHLPSPLPNRRPNADLMSYYSPDRVLLERERESRTSYFHVWALIVIPLLAILFQLYIPLYVKFLQYLDIPLLVTIYFAMMRRSQLRGLTIGMLLGLAQDSLSRNPIGMFGICRTVIGYIAASLALRIDVDHPLIRLLVTFLFYIFDQALLWLLERALLQLQPVFDFRQALLLGFLNAVVGLAMFHFLDRLKIR